MKRVVILGASRGLGAELVNLACQSGYSTMGFARKEAALQALQIKNQNFNYLIADLSKREDQDKVIQYLRTEDYEKVFCVAGGGPYALFGESDWKNHEWALNVTFLAHARALHAMAQAGRFAQVILVGSSVAEAEGDMYAASYSAAKHALRGLYASLRLDYPSWDVRLLSPGYMDTPMLPANAKVRIKGVYDPIDVANDVWKWSISADIGGYKVYPKHPS